MTAYQLVCHTNSFSLLLPSLIYFNFTVILWSSPLYTKKEKDTLKQSNWKQPCTLLFHRNLIWCKPIRHELLAVADGLEKSSTKALSPFSKRTVRCWECEHLVVTLHLFHCVWLLQATALASSYWSGSSDLNLCSLISPILSSPLFSSPILSAT